MPEQSPSKKNPLEGFKPVELRVKEPDQIHRNWGINLDTTNETEALSSAYNRAIQDVAKTEKLDIFHQLLAHPPRRPNAPNHHGWEFWVDMSREKVLALFPKIEAKARDLYPSLKEFYEYDEDEDDSA